MNNRLERAAAALAAITAFAVTWTNIALAVDANRFNLLYLLVVVVGLVGATLARMQPRGMAMTMAAVTFAQVLVPSVATSIWDTSVARGEAVPVIGLNGLFLVLFAISALLFQQVAKREQSA